MLFVVFSVCLSANAQNTPFKVSYSKESIQLVPGQTRVVVIDFTIPEKYFVYKDKTELEFLNLESLLVKRIEYPTSRVRQDPFFKKKLAVFEGPSQILVTFEVPPEAQVGKRMLEAVLHFQGCSDTLCYPEEARPIIFNFEIGGTSNLEPRTSNLFSWHDLIHSQDFSQVWEQSGWIMLVVVFIGGFLTSLTPCVLPLIPITLLIIGVRAESPVKRNLFLSLSLVVGLALTYAALGVLAVALGKSLGFIFQEKWIVILLALLFFILSLSMFGLYEIHLPLFLREKLNNIKGHGAMGAFASGMVTGVLAAPCAGPVVGSLLLFVAGTQSYFQGFFLLFVYAMGMGLLFVVLGTGYGILQGRFQGFGLSVWIKRFLGVLLLIGALFYLNTVVPLQKGFDILMKYKEPVPWLSSDVAGLEIAKKEQKIMLVDFYAEWCPPCKELEIGFFRKPEVVELLKKMVPVRIDATFNDDPVVEATIKKYKVIGWPTVLFVDSTGKVLNDLTVVSYNPKLLYDNMQKALGGDKP
ncbi:MAG: hypothetical protein A3F82_00890 [Deltaproteobacteria bacterium RIFCSPLOWO2_12_FULL_44_12]|nr:MAG: hypothetical protein A2712_04065 [Deltaproteobacteria bacterium RIFCSPHIGHO2_01_FULL_43_49]OGQ16360.1 MAG: hypothetical protein A3D22_02035 [Deltaproteobacteria bacterium RIFCSPHIGHO2_02_FULL_44_53]OGQ29320.1 MAG: hypothetical protein A3D98_05820 [Deltaproteobacteria bacterium RIFCSPHIGHO2_12_FULL_44_21]OGQ32878.1 MAG: hypothetical protein A2979_09965 [Deltaproteobacteria bacterium RIFCSPLOWO2_01_FULL_45_74]OGQ41979.1 MAG: hypothetical protein A3I70_09750 [Deltaproteobacteria bacterium 